MKISILISSSVHPVIASIDKWAKENSSKYSINIVHYQVDLTGGDILFLVSCDEIISKITRDKFKKTLVIHASDLPSGRGWSPHIWEIIHGASDITITLLEAEDKVDSGDIWTKLKVKIPSTALYDEINQIIFSAEIDLINFAISNFKNANPIKQQEEKVTYWPKRSPSDSEIDLYNNLAEQFDLIRVCDNSRFPAFFYKDGKKFKIIIEVFDG